MKLRSLVQQSALYTLGNIANRLAGFLLIPVYTSFLSPTEFGLLALVDLFLSLAVTTLGIQSVAGAMIRIFHDYEDEPSRRRVVSTALFGTIFLSAALVVVAQLIAPQISLLIFDDLEPTKLIRVSLVALFTSNLVEFLLVNERIRMRAGFFVSYSFVQLIATLSLNVWMIAFLDMGVWGFVYSKLIVSSVGALFLLARTLPQVGFGFDREAAKRIVAFGSPLILAGVSFFLIHFSDQFFLNRFRSTHEVGLYEFAYRFPFILTILVGEPFGRVWSVSLYDWAKKPNWKAEFARVIAYLAFFLAFIGLGIAVFADEVIELMAGNPSFHVAAEVVPMLVLAYAFREAADFFRNVLYLKKRSDTVGKLALGCAIVNVALNVLLIPAYGFRGAAVCTLITWALYLWVCLLAQRAEYDIPLPKGSFLFLVGWSVLCHQLSVFFAEDGQLWGARLAWNSLAILIFLVPFAFAPYFTSAERRGAVDWCRGLRRSKGGAA